MIPDEPICLMSAGIEGGFRYRDQFQACRFDLQSFANALDEHYRCTNQKLKTTLDDLLVSVISTYNCYVRFFADKDRGDPSAQCPPLDVPRFHHSYQVDGLEYDLGVPKCVSGYAPTSRYDLSNCNEQVEVFTGDNIFGYSWSAESAQKQYDTYMRNLRFELDRRLDDAVRRFNCHADGNDFCI